MVLRGRSPLTGSGVEIEVSADRVARIESIEVSAEAPYLAPGFIDIQVNGYRGIDYSGAALERSHVAELARSLGRTGTTSHVPTIITNPQDRILENLRTIAAGMDDLDTDDLAGAVPGVHVEGPYIAEDDGPRGAHDARFVRDPSIAEYEGWQEISGGRVLIVTVAPERRGALAFIERITRDGVVAAIGHTRADASVLSEAVAAGARLSTHIGNGSALSVHRLRNHLWPQLADDGLSASIVADGFHLPPEFLKVVARAKGGDRLVLISDVSPLAGSEPGRHAWGGTHVETFADGHLQVVGTEFLAGAGHLLDHCIGHFAALDLDDALALAVRACTINPARLLGLPDFAGGLALGARANIVLFKMEPEDRRIRVLRVLRNGIVVVGNHD